MELQHNQNHLIGELDVKLTPTKHQAVHKVHMGKHGKTTCPLSSVSNDMYRMD